MRRVDDRIGLSALTTVPTLRQAPAERSGPLARVPLLEVLVVALLVLLVASTVILAGRQQVNAEQAQVLLSISSDPDGASVIVDDLWVGRTPMEVDLTRGEAVSLRVEAREPYLAYDLYKPYRSEITLDGDRSLQVWIPRTTAQEQAEQLAGGN
ncbi:MAG: PEGA domain-containing protein [Trueperaceae bacterium]